MSKKNNKKFCNGCQKELALSNFYSTASILFGDGKVPVCKSCLRDMINPNDIESVKVTLQRIDKPFIAKVWKSSEDGDQDTVGSYFRMINSLTQYKDLNWADSDFEGENEAKIYKQKFDNLEDIEEMETEYGTIYLTKEIAMKFGSGFTNREYLQMENFYNEMCMTHDINTPQLKKQLVYLCKLQIQMDRAIEGDNSGDFKKYSDAYEGILRSSGFRPVDRKNSSEQSGLRSFSVIFEEVEKKGYVEPYNVEENQDIVDKTIMYLLNYTRVLVGMEKLSNPPKDTPKVDENEQ